MPLLKHKALTIHSWITFSLEIVVAVGEAEVKELGCHAEGFALGYSHKMPTNCLSPRRPERRGGRSCRDEQEQGRKAISLPKKHNFFASKAPLAAWEILSDLKCFLEII